MQVDVLFGQSAGDLSATLRCLQRLLEALCCRLTESAALASSPVAKSAVHSNRLSRKILTRDVLRRELSSTSVITRQPWAPVLPPESCASTSLMPVLAQDGMHTENSSG